MTLTITEFARKGGIARATLAKDVGLPDASSGRPNASRNSFLITASQKPFVTAGAKVKEF